MILEDYLNNEIDILEEGVRFFRNSKRIKKLVNKLYKKINLLARKEEKQEVMNTIVKLNELADEFEEIENQYKSNSYEAKMKYKELEYKYADIVKLLNKESVISAIKKIGAASLFAGAIFFSYNYFISSGVTSEFLNQAYANSELKAGAILKKTAESMSTKSGREAVKSAGDFRRDSAEAIKKITDKYPDLKGSFNATQLDPDTYLTMEKNLSMLGAGGVAVSSSIFLKLFYKITGKIRRNSLYYKTRMALEKLDKK